ncbi:hypothetical protein conserved [Entamoeba histolytica]|uniref:G domain-containing protein n=3 Tax=Entamoeba histolytica TaxID=5759 RepID=C4LY60_ENTH1|nr:hypothetical protein, conserved [Entamoeba histolytica HM-1:IMSS]EAL45902.1 hypothetical protein, conserved [Entamoeba histolytica HM-1:IMSS]GAT93726.1 hypothetical protein conserved [Entamoeba histolytica]|eukprot:XP_651288.1 hypothetical protein, conserved [Entamoeba histolytica HM-1:IMSS]
MSRVVVRFSLNGQCIANKPLNSQDKLKTAREKIKEKMSDSQHFLTKDGDVIDVNDEESYTIGDVIDEKRVINIKGTEVKKGIRIKINDKVLTTLEIDNKTKINIIRTLVQNIPESAHFYTIDNDKIERDEEEDYIVQDIINNEEINLKEEKENTSEEENVTIKINLNGKLFMKKQLNKNTSLANIRKKLEIVTCVTKGFVFKDQEGCEISTDKEKSLKLSYILHDNIFDITEKEESDTSPTNTSAHGTSQNNTINVSKQNIPIKGSKRLQNHEEGKLKIYLYPNEPFNHKDENDAIAILVVGETGSGKTTLLNSFVNALYGIKITDDFRYIIINEDHLEQYGNMSVSQTSQVSIYNIKRTKRTPPIKIIDTPGFGDTRGIAWDKEITKQIKKAFETKVFDLNAICFVASSSNVKLTASQKYIFGNIVDLFGKDVKKNFIAMLTFCDGKKPQVINALQSKECIFSTIIPEIDNPWYLKFNNSAIYDDNTEDEFTQMFWKLGMKNFDDFISKLVKLPRISLKQSREVLKRRECIKTQIEGLRISLNNGLLKLDEIKQYCEQFYLNRDKVKNNEDFTITVDITKQIKIDLEPGEYVTNCFYCHKTCHYRCYIPGDMKRECYCIDNDYCNVCKCHYKHHASSPYRFDYVIVKEKQTAQEILERYNEGKKGMANAESMLKKLEEEYYNIQMDCYDKEIEIIECVNKLSEIALNDKITSSNEYLDILIQTENEEKKTGYKVRIEGYKQLKQANEIIEDIMKKSTTKKSKEEIKAEYEVKRKELKEGEKTTMDKLIEKMRSLFSW